MSKAVILCGGIGSRLKPFTDAIPKPLLPVGEKAILEVQIERLADCGFDDIYLATNYKADYIERFLGDDNSYGAQLHFSKEDEPLGTTGPLKLLEKELDEPFLVINGDILSLVDFKKLFDFACQKESILTLGVKKFVMPYSFGNIFFDGDIVTGIQEKPDIVTYALAGIYVMKPEIMEYIPPHRFYNMDDLIKDLLAKHVTINKYEIEEYWLDIGRPDDYEKAQKEFASAQSSQEHLES